MRAFEGMGLKINSGKSKVLMFKRDQMVDFEKVRMSGEEM